MNVLGMLRPKYSLTYLQGDDLLKDGLSILQSSGYTAVPVIDEQGKYVGSVSEGDFLRVLLERGMDAMNQMKIKDIIKQGFNLAVTDDVEVDVLLQRALDQNFIPMVDDRNCFIGIITRREIIKSMLEDKKDTLLLFSEEMMEI